MYNIPPTWILYFLIYFYMFAHLNAVFQQLDPLSPLALSYFEFLICFFHASLEYLLDTESFQSIFDIIGIGLRTVRIWQITCPKYPVVSTFYTSTPASFVSYLIVFLILLSPPSDKLSSGVSLILFSIFVVSLFPYDYFQGSDQCFRKLKGTFWLSLVG